MDWAAIKPELTKKLDPAAVKPPPKGKFGEYVDGFHIISEANRIFGHGGWSYEITRLEQASLEIFELTDRDGVAYAQLRAAYVCTVRANVGGTIREGAAVGTGNGKPENVGDVIESAVKEAETDALKRALRCFGNTFGLALYEKDKAKRAVGVDRDWSGAAENIKSALSSADSVARLGAVWAGNKADLAKMKTEAPTVFEEIEAFKDVRKTQLDPAVQTEAAE